MSLRELAMNGSEGPRKCKRNAVIGAPLHAGTRINDGYAFTARDAQAILIRVSAVRLPAICDLCDAYLTQHRRAPTDVIAVWMRDDQGVELVDAATQKERYDDAFADSLRGRIVALLPAFEASAGVDEKRVAGGRFDDDRIGLSDVERP